LFFQRFREPDFAKKNVSVASACGHQIELFTHNIVQILQIMFSCTFGPGLKSYAFLFGRFLDSVTLIVSVLVNPVVMIIVYSSTSHAGTPYTRGYTKYMKFCKRDSIPRSSPYDPTKSSLDGEGYAQ